VLPHRREHDEARFRGSVLDSVSAEEVEIDQSAVRAVRGDEVEVDQSAVLLASGSHLRVTGSATVGMVAREIQARDVNAVFLLSPRVNGTVRTVFDLRAAFAFGLGIVLGRQLVRLLRLR
jgi:hypothetical protein